MELDLIRELTERLRTEVRKVIMGQDAALDLMLVALLSDGHVLLEGVPGTAKTLLARAFAAALGIDFNRVQFTPDLMPGDVVGTNLFHFEKNEFVLKRGPIFTDILVADEINRTPPKTQAAMLEAMEERQISVEGASHPLPEPFLVVATQNPVEYEGTYPLPEAELDRFLLKLAVGYPDEESERRVLRMHDEGRDPHDLASFGVEPVASSDDLAAGAEGVRDVVVSDAIVTYVLALASETRRSPSLSLGASPRGAAMLMTVSKAWAFLSGRSFVTPDDVKALVPAAWRHRIILRPEVELEGATADAVLDGVLRRVPVPD